MPTYRRRVWLKGALMNPRKIDLDHYPRRALYEVFKDRKIPPHYDTEGLA